MRCRKFLSLQLANLLASNESGLFGVHNHPVKHLADVLQFLLELLAQIPPGDSIGGKKEKVKGK